MRDDLRKRARSIVSTLELPRVRFELAVGWGPNYRAIFSADELTVRSPDSILDEATQSGRVLLCGRAGSGKSVILRRLAKRSSEAGAIVVLIDLSRGIPIDTERLSDSTNDPTSCMNLLVNTFSGLDATLLDLDMIPSGESKVILIDGINEVPASLGTLVLRAADEAVTRLINSCVIVTDRLARRPISEDRWRLARVEPLTPTSIRKAWRDSGRSDPVGQNSLLEWPFFLARAIDEGRPSGSGTEALRQFFTDRVRLSDGEMRTVSAASYDAYVRFKSRTFPRAAFADQVGDATVNTLVTAGALELTGENAHFRHHLHHDFLAAMHEAANENLWGYASFNVLSFQGSAFDAIALAFAQAPKASKPAFVRKVYDWNPYAISFALAEADYRQTDDIDWELESVVLAMLAERRWDPIIPTAEKSSDALSLFPRKKSSAFLGADSLQALVRHVSQLPSELAWFNEWKLFFCIESADLIREEAIARLSDPDSIIGWTLANVLKRFPLDAAQLLRVMRIAEDRRPEVRWRAAHVLGATPAPEAAAAAFELLDRDENTWVKYGALRSLIEMAALGDATMRGKILGGVVERRESISPEPRLRDELVRAVRIRPGNTSSEWLPSALGVLSSYLESSSTVEDVDYWARAMRQLRSDETRREG